MYWRFLFFCGLVVLLLTGCTSKTVTYLDGITLLGKPKSHVSNPTLQEIADILHTDANATLLYIGQPLPDNKKSLIVFVTDKYLKIMFPVPNMFAKEQTSLSDTCQKELQKLIPVLQKYPGVIIQIIGHAYEEGDARQMRHFADMRAISVAEYLYESGLKQEILAKGCSDQVPKKICNPNKPHTLCSMQNRRVEVFIYSKKADVITKCR